ncbi:cilia- and flagella-associated protein 54-like isoform X2 [Etheostoma cragini]|uniref:cilia- and flagella-associated protein 54-like isoform X2 n=1 Tax=Etheostoma cragini TaxID=417921 RepID=UPI00155F002F|nr:cilia- and flagella-associated protein 54-like isoform X2 [Etheostoma cragini]
MDLPASYYGELDKRNPVISAFERDINSFITLMKRVASSTSQDNGSYAKGIKILVEIWKKYKHRLPSKLYQKRMLQIADFLSGIKLYHLALWQGYSLHLLQFNSVKITDITDVDHFMACFFPEGFDTDQDTFTMKIRAMQGCALCIFEQEKSQSILSQKGLCKLLHLLNFIRIMMQAFQQHEHLCWQIYNGSLHIYTICRYLMTMNCSAEALEYLLWASISLEFSIPLMTAKCLPWIVTLYCAVCHCYYNNQAALQAEEFARRALGKINELAKLEEQNKVPATRETQRAFKEASIKLAAMIFKRAVFEARRRHKPIFRIKTKSTLKDIPNAPWPRTTTEHMLMGLFDSSAARFLGILEALWDSTRRPLQTRMPDNPELQEVILELLSAGISILSGDTTTSKSLLSPSALTPTSTLMELAVTGENKVPIMSAMRFIKMLFQYKQPDAFTELARDILQVLSGVEGQSFRRAELEVALLDSFNSVLSSQKSHPREDNIVDDRHKSSFSMSDEFIGLVDTLHKSVCGSAPEVQPDGDLVLDVVLFLWGKVKLGIQRDQLHNLEFTHYLKKVDNYDKWLWCLSMLCEVAFACDLATVDCIMTVEMIHTLAILLESTAEHTNQYPRALDAFCEGVKPRYFSLLENSSRELLQKVCEVVERGLEALAKGVATLLPRDYSAIIDPAFIQKFCLLPPLTPTKCSLISSEESNVEDETSEKEKEAEESKAELDSKAFPHTQSTRVFLLATDLHLQLDIIHHRASLKLLQLNAVAESELLDRINKNKVSKALFLIQKASMAYNNMGPNNSNKAKSLLEEASTLIEKAGMEERKLFMSTILKTPAENKDKGIKEKEENPPPPPILLSRTDHSLTFAPAPYNLEGQVSWYQLCGRAADGINRKVRLGDCSLPGTGNMVSAVSDECVLRVEGLEPNQKYVFAVAAYNSQGKLLGNTIGGSTFPLLASLPLPLLSTWAHLAQVAFQTEQYAVAKRACRELWIHYTYPDPRSHSTQERLAITGLHVQTLQRSSPHLCQLFLASVFIETEINIQQGSLHCDSFSDNGPFIWEQEARLAECKRMLVATDLAMWLNDGSAAVQAVVTCYGLLAPLIFHQIFCDPVVQVLKKCLIVLEENSGLLKQKWTGNKSESLMHMIACITYYLSKALRVLREHQMASVVMDCGRSLLQEVYDAQLQIPRLTNKASKAHHASTIKGEIKISLQLKALHWKNKKRITSEEALTADDETARPLTGCEDPTIMYDLISNSTLKDAYQDVMKHRREAYFIEFAALLIQRTMEEGHPDLVLKWGQSMFEFLSRRDEVMGLSTKCLEGNNHSKRRSSAQAPKGNEPPQKNKNSPSLDDTRKKLKQKMPPSMLQRVRTNREMQVVENLLTIMSSVVRRHKKQLQLRNTCCEERVWKSHLNYSMAQAHLALLYQGLDQLHGGALQHSYRQLNPLCFSLAYSGILVWRDSQPQQSSKNEAVPERDSSQSGLREYVAADQKRSKTEVKMDDSVTEESCEEGEDSSQIVEQQIETHRHTAVMLLNSLEKAALHLRRAMVLAHRGSHWTTLQCVCHTVWDQSCRINILVQRAAQLKPPSSIIADQLHTTFTPLLVLATDLIMDMLNRLGLWSLYDSDLTEEELESSLHFSAPMDNSTQVDLRWVRTLVLHTLECLHDSGTWEKLAHFALLFNSYTRERYALITTPLLVYAQRRLLERIYSCGGPAVPQPHHVKTQKATGKEVTYRSYAGSQLLIGWTPHPAQQLPIHKKATLTNYTPRGAVDLKGAEIQHSRSLVCVPLDVEDTLSCYRQALEKRPHCLQVFHHSRSLLLLLLAYTKPCFAEQLIHCQSRSLSHSASLVEFSPLVMPTPNIQPCDLTEEDYSTADALYSLPISPDHISTVSAAYSTLDKYLQANNHDSLRILVLHEMGNLQFYNGNTRAAHSHWSKAVDCALQSSGAVEKWDGVFFGGGSLQQTLKQAGIWGCLQAAGLTAKIAQYILTSDISQRTKCSLMSAHLFKCVLCCSLAQPQADLQYACHNIGDELLPGVDLFSEPHRVHLGTTVTSLNFVCHWLFTTGYYITLLPMLALYLHFVGTVCRDLKRTVEGKILKIRALTELCLFTEAVKETVQLTQGTGVFLPHGHYIAKDNLQPVKTFYSNKSLLDNAEALEELVNCDFAPDVSTMYGSTLCLRFNLARVQLVLALSNTVHNPPVPDAVEGEACASLKSCLVKSKPVESDILDNEGSCQTTGEPKVLTLDTKKERLSPERIKFLLLEGASSLFHSMSQQLPSQSCSEMENLELAIESNLLKANLYLQQGHAALSSEMAISSLVLLQTSPVIMRGIIPGSQKPASEIPHARIRSGTEDCNVSDPLDGDCPGAVEASERIGVSLWLRCRLALVRSLAANIPGTAALFPGKNFYEEADRALQDGLDECARWRDLDIQALLMVEGAELEARRGKIDDSMDMLQEAMTLLSGRTCMPPGSGVTLARATLLLSDLRGAQSTTLLKLTQKLLKKQLCIFGQSVVLDDGKMYFSPPGPSNIYLPYLTMLDQTTLRIGHILDLSAVQMPVSTQSSQSPSRQHSHQSSQTERETQAPDPCLNNPSTSRPTSHPCSARKPE